MSGPTSEPRESVPPSGAGAPGDPGPSAAPGGRPPQAKPAPPAAQAPAGSSPDAPVAAERRTRVDRRQSERRRVNLPIAVERRTGGDRRKTPERRRGLNKYELDAAEMEFIQAIQRFKDRTGRPFPTWSEVLGILRSLGYEKRP